MSARAMGGGGRTWSSCARLHVTYGVRAPTTAKQSSITSSAANRLPSRPVDALAPRAGDASFNVRVAAAFALRAVNFRDDMTAMFKSSQCHSLLMHS